MTLLAYLLFFLSGAAALVYEVVWLRSLILVFGGSHLAVTSVLSVFMGGLALGGWLIGRRVDRLARPLRVYGVLEIGIGLFAVVFVVLVRLYPVTYVPLARLADHDPVVLTTLRVLFSVVAMIVPTTLMGGTLPVLARFASDRGERFSRHLAFLYGLNTLGAVAGSLGAGFLLLPNLGTTRSLGLAVAINLFIGLVALALSTRLSAARTRPPKGDVGEGSPRPAPPDAAAPTAAARAVLWGIGVSGFCALGYEVLWTRVLSVVIGTSVYSFTIMLVAFLTGIGLGGHAMAWLPRRLVDGMRGWRPTIVAFAAAQLLVGITALGTTFALRALPSYAIALQRVFLSRGDEFAARQGTGFVLAFALMVVPAFFMGIAFPLAGVVHAARVRQVGGAIGEVLAFNTVGAILGAASAGFLLVYLFGIEASLQILSAVNVGLAIVVAASVLARPLRAPLIACAIVATAVTIVALAGEPEWARMWDRKFFAIYRNNQRAAFSTPERVRDAMDNTDVLYYHEGVNETISVIKPKSAPQAFIVNGRSEATTLAEDIQCQRTLGHLPMLVHPSPRNVFVLGLGTGMTLGATSIHPEVERLTLAEIERGVFGAARTFREFNHDVLDAPKLRIIHDDGRNFLRTTDETFDVITADPIHPWSGGASYLYTTEYFATAAKRLAPGGVICQWLPIYELTVEDLRSVVRTFSDNFRYTALWLTYYDAELLGSNDPLVLDEDALARRFANPAIARDLDVVAMGTPRDFLSFMLAGDAGVRDFARGGALNTDDNLLLEFSSPRSRGVSDLMGSNVLALAEHRENPLDTLAAGPTSPEAAAERRAFWSRFHATGPTYDRAHALALWRRFDDPEFRSLLDALLRDTPDHAPTRFLARQQRRFVAGTPRPTQALGFPVVEDDGTRGSLEITAVVMHVGRGRGSVVFVDNAVREVYGERYVDAPEDELDDRLEDEARRVLAALSRAYEEMVADAGGRSPDRRSVSALLRGRVRALTSTSP